MFTIYRGPKPLMKKVLATEEDREKAIERARSMHSLDNPEIVVRNPQGHMTAEFFFEKGKAVTRIYPR